MGEQRLQLHGRLRITGTDSDGENCSDREHGAVPVSWFRVDSLSQSGMMTAWFLAARFACTRFPEAVPLQRETGSDSNKPE